MLSPVIVALDFPDQQQALRFAQGIDPALCRLKVGKELFTASGPSVVDALHQLGFSIFLDLKFHDIPNTTAQACLAAARLGVWMVNVHASGGPAMLDAARAALDKCAKPPLLIAVTVLTSMDTANLRAIGIGDSPEAQVLRLARLAHAAGLDGVVASPLEVPSLRQALPAQFQLVTPGVRPSHAARDDQQRISTPADALRQGANHLVIGRPITQAADPQRALEAILAEIRPYLGG
ncbi:MAG: orotidine-5'-phosphate decarboxylase [Pseudomonadota bacterium]|uniref:orotidine-5'-phosphate decarboxylase n=1 Tax=Thermithiobacillus tepidarius TaxID=929 RepID=UPI00041D2C8E|nr:orotidine-5'-phosphate decarboxylase [Thermithiobacillus tepidarius]